MIPPIFTKLFEKLNIINSKTNSPTAKVKNLTKGNNSPITNNLITNVYNQSFNEQEVVVSAPRTTKPTPRDIVNEIKSRPLLQQKVAEDNYKNLSVLWEVKLFSIREYNDILNVSSIPNDGKQFPDILCDVKKADYPVLGIMKQDDVFYVKGKISQIEGMTIRIADAQLIFVGK